ncbi:MAG TPA: BTAD domain-containing putative transcriptional regulator [Anaerolineae bacterium]|nr:BTAD domain-containing putative transcriptional regulator [Anaerolineae bacterium]
MSRPRLLRLLNQALASRLTLLIAPAGYGKTTLLSQWLGDGAEVGPGPVLRYTLSEMDNDAAHLLSGLVAGVRARFAGLAPAVDLSGPLSYSLSLLFQQAARSVRGPWLVVLDDYHHVTSPAIHGALDTLLGMPAWPVHLVLSSRTQPPLAAVARLRVEGRLTELDETDLHFTLEEVHCFLAAGGFDLDEASLRQATERTEGWPAALELIRQAARREPRPDLASLLGSIGDERPLFDYLAGQVMVRQPKELQEFLQRTSLLPYLSAELCNALLGITGAGALLENLERSHLFVSRLADRTGRCYRYHALFQGFLQRELGQAEGAASVEAWHRRAAACLLEGPDVDDRAAAVGHLLAAREWTAAARVTETLAEVLDFGALPRMEPWLERLPPSAVAERPRLLVALGRIRERQGRYPEALAVLQQAERAAVDAGSARDVEEALRWQAWARFRQNRYEEAIKLCHRALDALGEGQSEGDEVPLPRGAAHDRSEGNRLVDPDREQRLAKTYNILANCHGEDGDPILGRQYARRALELFRSTGDREREAVVMHNMAAYTLTEGLLRETIAAEQTSLRLLEEVNSYRICFPLITLGQAYLLGGEWDAARAVLERLLRLTDAYQDEPRRGYALYLLGHLHREAGARAVARRCYHEAQPVADKVQERYLSFEVRRGWALLELGEGNRSEALRQARAALEWARMVPDALEGHALAALGQILSAGGDTPQAEAHFRRALEIAEATGGLLDRASVRLDLADLCRREARDKEALLHLGHSLTLSRQHGYDFLFTRRDTGRAAALLVLALGQAEHSAVCETSEVVRLLAAIGQKAVEPLVALLGSTPDDPVREQAVRLLGEIGDERATPVLSDLGKTRDRRLKCTVEAALARIAAAPRPPLRVLALGGFRVLRGEVPIPDEAWQPRRKARLLLLYLLGRAPRRVPRDELIDALWPDLPPDSAGPALNTTFSELRRILEPYLGQRQPSRYLAREEETLVLHAVGETWYDVTAFREAARAGGQAARQALELYRGDFLPEEPYVDWVLRERERLRGLYLNTLTAWLEEQVQAGAWREGAELARRILEMEPWLEEVWRALMTCLARLGRRSEALHAYQDCARALRDELDAAPSPETQALYEALRV